VNRDTLLNFTRISSEAKVWTNPLTATNLCFPTKETRQGINAPFPQREATWVNTFTLPVGTNGQKLQNQ